MHMEQVYKQWKNQKKNKKQKKRGNFEIYKAGYYDSGYLLLLGKNDYSFQVFYK